MKRRLSRNAMRLTIPVLLIAHLWAAPSRAASISNARDNRDGKPLPGILVEGDIEQGDARRLQSAVLEYDVINEPYVARFVYLRSKGGDVAEAMKMGAFIRRLRLETEVPTQLKGQEEIFSWVSPADRHNNICASACFLVYAGGVERSGNLLALHRPYFPRNLTTKISDLEYEFAEKRAMSEVRQYLKDMDVTEFFIDKVMSNSSQDAYHVALWETDEYHLSQIVPSLEETVLTRCVVVTSEEARRIDSGTATSEERERILVKHKTAFDCEKGALDDMRLAAFKREMTNLSQGSASRR